MPQRPYVKFLLFLTAYCLVLSATATASFANVPKLIRYQGFLKNSQGVPLEGPYTLTFRLYPAATGSTPLWTETQTSVPVSTGSFSVLLGSGTTLPAGAPGLDTIDWSTPAWLSIQVGPDPELAPRQQITSVPLAIRAGVAESLSTPVTTSNITDDANRLVPSGAILMVSSASCPTGYTRLATLDGKFLVGGATFNAAAGGSDTLNLAHSHGGSTGSHALTIAEIPSHTHSTPAHTHSIIGAGSGLGSLTASNIEKRSGWAGSGWADVTTVFQTGNQPGTNEGNGTSGSTGGDGGHTHTISSDLSSVDNRPAFATVLLCQKN